MGSDIAIWSQRRDANDIRQGSGAEGTPSEPVANGVSLEYMVALANELDADPWFNMPYLADDMFVRNFATYVREHLEPGRKVYVEWANEVWNFGWGFEASQWVAERARAFYAATNDPRMGEIYRDYLVGLDAAGLNLSVDFQFTGQAGAAPWGDFAKLHRMDEPLTSAHRYAAVAAAADGSLWGGTPAPPPVDPPPPPPPPPPELSIAPAAIIEGSSGRKWLSFAVTLSAASPQPVTVAWGTANQTAKAGSDYERGSGSVTFSPGQREAVVRVLIKGDRLREADETFRVVLSNPVNSRLSATAGAATGTIVNDDGRVRSALFAALAESTSSTRKARRA